jgi:hypothetical protein
MTDEPEWLKLARKREEILRDMERIAFENYLKSVDEGAKKWRNDLTDAIYGEACTHPNVQRLASRSSAGKCPDCEKLIDMGI